MARLRLAARLVIVSTALRKHRLQPTRRLQRRIKVFAVNDSRLVHLPHFVEHAVGKAVLTMPDLQPSIRIFAYRYPLARQLRADRVWLES